MYLVLFILCAKVLEFWCYCNFVNFVINVYNCNIFETKFENFVDYPIKLDSVNNYLKEKVDFLCEIHVSVIN